MGVSKEVNLYMKMVILYLESMAETKDGNVLVACVERGCGAELS